MVVKFTFQYLALFPFLQPEAFAHNVEAPSVVYVIVPTPPPTDIVLVRLAEIPPSAVASALSSGKFHSTNTSDCGVIVM